MNRLLSLVVIASLLIGLLAAPAPAIAQTACGDYTCAFYDEFNNSLDGWVGNKTIDPTGQLGQYQAEAEWLADKTLGPFWDTTSARGVAHAWQVYGSNAGIQKVFELSAGRYQVVTRAAQDWSLTGGTLMIDIAPPTGGLTEQFSINDRFKEFISSEFVVEEAGPVSIEILHNARSGLYVDYVWVIESTIPQPTPGPGTPSPTPPLATSTPLPVGTPYCVEAVPTPTPGPGQFATPTPAPTAGPTPTPGADLSWSMLDTFDDYLNPRWWTIGGDGIVKLQINTGNPSSTAGSVAIQYSSDPPGWDFEEMERTALIYQHVADVRNPSAKAAFSLPFDLRAFGSAQSVPAGQTAYIETWVYDPQQPRWYKLGETAVSAGRWYSFHYTVTAPGGSSGVISAVAFTARRTDEPASGVVYLDDFYVWGNASLAPLCGGRYPPQSYTITKGGTSQTGGSGLGPGAGIDGDPGDGSLPPYYLRYPMDKDCPPGITVPNNIYGPILAGLTILLDVLYADSPSYELGLLPAAVRMFLAPFSIALVLFLAFIRFDALWQVVVVRLATGAFLLLRAGWLFIVRTIKG